MRQETRRTRTYLMLVIDLLTFSAPPIAVPPSEPRLLLVRLQKVTHNRIMMTSPFLLRPPHNETETRRVRAYLMLVIEVLTLRAPATALPPSAPRSLYMRLQKVTHDDPFRS